MPRDSSGNYTLTAGNPVVSGTIISSGGWWNPLGTDLTTVLTDSLSRSGLGGMLAQLALVDGTVGTPGLGFVSEAGLGIYRSAAATLATVTNGVLRQTVNGTGNWVFAAPTSGVAVQISQLAALTSVALQVGNAVSAPNGHAASFSSSGSNRAGISLQQESTTGVGNLVGVRFFAYDGAGLSQLVDISASDSINTTPNRLFIHASRSNGSIALQTNAATRFTIDSAGQITVGQPAGAGSTALALSGQTAAPCVTIDMTGSAQPAIAYTLNAITSPFFSITNAGTNTGAAAPTLTANKPGGPTGVQTWLVIKVNAGTTGYIPVWS